MSDLKLPGAPYISYQDQNLMMEKVALKGLAEKYGTPLFAYSKAAMMGALQEYKLAFQGRKARIHYAMKANSSLGVLRVFAQNDCGFDIVSGVSLPKFWQRVAKQSTSFSLVWAKQELKFEQR